MLIKFLNGAEKEIANLRGAYLQDANLQGAYLQGAYLQDAYLQDAKGLEQQSIVSEGTIIGYKKLANGTIATLEISKEVIRLNAYGSRKCRAASAIVIALDGPIGTDKHSQTITYDIGNTIIPDGFDADKRIECSHGIHFFFFFYY